MSLVVAALRRALTLADCCSSAQVLPELSCTGRRGRSATVFVQCAAADHAIGRCAFVPGIYGVHGAAVYRIIDSLVFQF